MRECSSDYLQCFWSGTGNSDYCQPQRELENTEGFEEERPQEQGQAAQRAGGDDDIARKLIVPAHLLNHCERRYRGRRAENRYHARKLHTPNTHEIRQGEEYAGYHDKPAEADFNEILFVALEPAELEKRGEHIVCYGEYEAEARRLQKKIAKNKFDFNDFLKQIHQIKKMGNIKELASMIPGVGKALKDVEIDDDAFKGIEAIIYSMTPYERANPGIINQSRRARIAAGSGSKIQDVNRLIKQFDQTRKMMKMVTDKNLTSMMKNMKGQLPNMNMPE